LLRKNAREKEEIIVYIIKGRKERSKCTALPGSSAIWLMGVLVVFLATADAAGAITKGPFLLGVYHDRAALMWQTDAQGAGKISYGQDGQLENYVVTKPVKIECEGREPVFIHKAWIEGLQAGRVYKYRTADAQAESKIYSFRTPSLNTDQVRFAVYGDCRGFPERHRKIVEQIIKQKVDFVVVSGDLVTNGSIYQQWQTEFFEPLKGLAETVAVYAVKGNHDLGKQNYFKKLLVRPGQTGNFSFRYGPVSFYCADNYSGSESEVLARIADNIAATNTPWKFVSYHEPSINFGGHWSGWGYPDALVILAGAGADFVITGHSHQYERFRPIAPPAGTNAGYVTYITSAGGGAPLYKIEPSVYHAKAEKVYHFCLFSIKANKLTMDAIDINGKIIDHLEITKTAGRLNNEYLQTAVPLELIGLHHDLHQALAMPLAAPPRKNQPFAISCNLVVPALAEPVKMTFELHGQNSGYELPKAKTITIPKEGGNIDVGLMATPLVEVKAAANKHGKPRPIAPALWIECRYQTGSLRESISLPIRAKPL